MRRFYTVMTAVALTVATVFSGVSTVQRPDIMNMMLKSMS